MRKHTLFALENGQGCGIAGLGAAGIASNTCFFGFVFCGALGPGPRALILEVEYIRKHKLFASETDRAVALQDWGCGSRLQHVFLGVVFWAGLI